MRIRKKVKNIIYRDKKVLKGTPCFIGTRVPVSLVLDYLSKGWSINDLKTSYPTVRSEYIAILLEAYSREFRINGKR
jgi:uncharacterized protein (DUF433 family)